MRFDVSLLDRKGDFMESSPGLIRDGFRVTQKKFVAHQVNSSKLLDPITKRNAAVYDLFANHIMPISEITRALDVPYGTIVQTLIEGGFIYERRQIRQEAVKVERRHGFFESI